MVEILLYNGMLVLLMARRHCGGLLFLLNLYILFLSLVGKLRHCFLLETVELVSFAFLVWIIFCYFGDPGDPVSGTMLPLRFYFSWQTVSQFSVNKHYCLLKPSTTFCVFIS